MNTQIPQPASRKQSVRPREAPEHDHGFYARTFTAEEKRRLDAEPLGSQHERNLLRTKLLRLARLTPLKKINDKELEALMKIIRLVAALDALERTGVMSRKVDAAASSDLDAIDELDPTDLRAFE
jgi:hypothetical protein